MVCCAHCKISSVKWKQLSFHRFPKDDEFKQRWIESLGHKNWKPTEPRAWCSEHFEKHSIDFRDQKTRLRKGHCPTIFKSNKENESELRGFPAEDNIDKPRKRQKIDHEDLSYSLPKQVERSSDKPEHLMTRQNEDEAMTVDNEISFSAGRTSLEVVRHDHTNSKSIDSLEQQLETALARNTKWVRETDSLNQKQKRIVKKLNKV